MDNDTDEAASIPIDIPAELADEVSTTTVGFGGGRSPVPAIVATIRGYVNKARKQHQLMQNTPYWNQLCTAMDVIEDTDLAMSAHRDEEYSEKPGMLYLVTYGVLQAIFQQQDAIEHLQEALGIHDKLPNDPTCDEIRELRNDAIGHPTKRRGRKGTPISYHAISRISLSRSGFQMLSYAGGEHDFRTVNLSEKVASQRRCSESILTCIVENLRREEMAHKEAFRSEKLTAIYPEALHYYFEKLFASTNSVEGRPLAIAALSTIMQILDDVKQALVRRGIIPDSHDAIKAVYGEVERPLTRIARFLNITDDGLPCGFDGQDASIYIHFLSDKMRELHCLLVEIDEEYASVAVSGSMTP